MNIAPQALSTAAQAFGLELAALRPLGGMDGLACEYSQGEKQFVLKVTPAVKLKTTT